MHRCRWSCDELVDRTYRWGIVTCVGRRVPSYRSIVLRRVVVRVAVARASRVDGGADGRQVGGSRGVGRALVVRVGVMGMVVAVVVLLVRQGDGVRRLMWLRSCAKSSWCLRRRVVSCLPLGPCHHSFTRVAVHGRATSTAKPQRAEERSTIGGGQQRRRQRLAGSARGRRWARRQRMSAGVVRRRCAQAPVGGGDADAGDGEDEVGRTVQRGR